MTSKLVEIVPTFHREGNASLRQPSDGLVLKIGPRPEHHLPSFSPFRQTPPVVYTWAVDFPGLRRHGSSSQIIDQAQDFPEQFLRHGDLGQLERDVPAMADDLGADLDQLSRSVVNDQCSTSFGKANVRMKLARL